MTNYIPEFETQRDEGAPTPWTNCTLASGAMLVDQWSYGRKLTNDVQLRAASGVDPRLGTNFAALRKALMAVERVDLRYSEQDGSGNAPISWARLRDHLAKDGGAVVCGNYNSLVGWTNERGQALTRWQPGGTFGHAMFVCDYRPTNAGGDGTVLLMDPLGHGDYAGDRISINALWAFIWKRGQDASAIVTAAWTFAGARPSSESREQRLAREVIALREDKPRAASSFRRNAMEQGDDGRPLKREDRLAAEKLALTWAPKED